MITYLQARDAIINRLHSNWNIQYPGVELVFENSELVDLDKVGDAFVRATLAFESATQATLGETPIQRVTGHLYLGIYSRAGTGSRNGLVYLEYLANLFKHQNLSGVQVGTPDPIYKESHDGWHLQTLAVPFFFHVA